MCGGLVSVAVVVVLVYVWWVRECGLGVGVCVMGA